MKKCIVILTFFITTVVIGQTNSEKQYFDKSGLRSEVFVTKNAWGTKTSQLDSEIFQLTIEDARHIDSLVFCYVFKESKKKNGLRQQGMRSSCPIIYQSWNDYYKQAIGYIDSETNHRIVFIQYIHENMIEKKNIHLNWKNELITVSDGCSNFWSIVFDMDRGKILQWHIN